MRREHSRRWIRTGSLAALVGGGLVLAGYAWVQRLEARLTEPAVGGVPDPGDGPSWPQWHGPQRDNRCPETGLLQAWPPGGPRRLWICRGLGQGWSSPTLAAGGIFVTGAVERREILCALDLRGRLQWQVPYGSTAAFYRGARSTPTYDDGHLYVTSGRGELACIDVTRRLIAWKLDARRVFGGRAHHFGTAESPLVHDGKVFYTPGGARTTLVALDQYTGVTVWESPSLDDQSAYVSPILVCRGGRTLVVTVTGYHILGVEAQTGRILWAYPYVEAHRTKARDETLIQNAVTPLYHDGQLFVTSGYNHRAVALSLSDDGGEVQLRWENDVLDCHHGGVVLHAGFLYGSNWLSNTRGHWACLDWVTGATRYEVPWRGKGAVLYADGRLLCYAEKTGHLALVRPKPEAFEVVSEFSIRHGSGEHWAHPVICGGRLYVRHGDALAAFDVTALQAREGPAR